LVKYCKRFSAIIFSIIIIGIADAQDVYWEPNYPVQSGQVTIYYNLENSGVLPVSTNPCYIHLGYNGWSNTSDYAMTKNGDGLWQYEMTIPNNATIIDFVFTNLQGDWDNNGGVGVDWHIDVYSEGLSVVVVSPEISILFGDPLRSPVFALENKILPIVVTTVTTSVPSDSIFLLINDNLVKITIDDTLKYDFDTAIYPPDEYLIKGITKDINGSADTSEFAIVVRPEQTSLAPPNIILPGINQFDSDRTIFVLFAPYKEFVYLVGDVNDWKVDNDYLMNQYEISPDSVLWWIDILTGNGGSYQYLVDGEIRIADPYSELILDRWNDKFIPSSVYPNLPEYPDGMTDEAVSYINNDQSEFEWQRNNSFEKPEQKDLVIYELLIRDFIEQHDYNTLINTLDYLENLGINAIELMPINEFEGNSSWGYNPSFYIALDKYYGPKDDLKAFIDECHRRGIAIIQDIVLNHSYSQSPLVRLYWDDQNNHPAENNPWYNKKSPNPVFSWGYDFNHDSEHTKYFTDRVLRYWIEEYKIDGFRLDFTKGLTNKGGDGSSYDASRIAILNRIADRVWSYAPSTYIILEHFADNVEEKELANYGFMLWGNTNFNYNEATMGYNSNSDFSWGFYKSRGWTVPHLVTYMESHDEERLMYKNLQFGNSSGNYNIKDFSTAIDRQKLAAAFYLTLPGPKMIWQFGELGYDFSIDYNGRVGEKPIRWDYFHDTDRKELYDLYSKLLKLRNENEVFRSPQTSVELSLNNSNGLKRIRLTHSSLSVIIIGNFGVTTNKIKPEFFYSGYWYDYLSGTTFKIDDTNKEFEVTPGQFRIFTNQKLSNELDINDTDDPAIPLKLSLSQNYPNPFNPTTIINYTIPKNENGIDDKVTLKLYNVLGKEIAVLVDDVKPSGEYHINFSGTYLSNGLYIYTLTYRDILLTKKMLLLK